MFTQIDTSRTNEHDKESWFGHPLRRPLPPLRLVLVWDHLAGHLTDDLVDWLFDHGILPLDTPLSGSWLNMAESVQRMIVRRALSGQHPKSAQEVIDWLEPARGCWNHASTSFAWNGKRQQRPVRARIRRLGGSGAAILAGYLIVGVTH
jgi:hypothetical protein